MYHRNDAYCSIYGIKPRSTEHFTGVACSMAYNCRCSGCSQFDVLYVFPALFCDHLLQFLQNEKQYLYLCLKNDYFAGLMCSADPAPWTTDEFSREASRLRMAARASKSQIAPELSMG